MLVTQTLEKLRAMRLDGMVQALEEQSGQTDISELDFEKPARGRRRSGSGSGRKPEHLPRACATPS